MLPFSQFSRLSLINGSRFVLHGRSNFMNAGHVYNNYSTRKSAEDILGIEKPKRPLTPYFKFMNQMRTALLAKNPGISSKEAVTWTSKHWQQLDAETKNQMMKEYEKDAEDFKKIKAIYEASLTDAQKEDIQRVRDEMAAAKEKRKLRAEYKELGRPRKPMTSYFLFCQTKKSLIKHNHLKEFHQQMKKEWVNLPETEKLKYEKEGQELMKKYKLDLEAWKMRMISMGKTDVLTVKTRREQRPKIAKSAK